MVGLSGARGAATARRAAGGLSFSGALSLAAVAAVLVVVSVPRLRGLAMQENEVDARATAQLLARALDARDEAGVPTLRDLLRRPGMSSSLADAELVVRGTLLRRHGYLFEVTRLEPSLSLPAAPASLLSGEKGALHSMLAIRAWPWLHGATGEAAFLATAAGACLMRANAVPLWQGPEAAGLGIVDLAGWQPAP